MAQPIPWRDFSIVTASVALVGVGIGVLSPLTALTLDARGHGSDVVGLLIALTSLGGVLGAAWAPRFTHRPGACLALASVLAALGTFPNDFSANLYTWGALRVLFGVAMGLVFTSSEAAINQLAGAGTRGRLVALYTTTFTVCQLFGPALVAALRTELAWPFSAAAALFLLPLPLLLGLRATTGAEHSAGGSRWRDVWPRMPAIVLGTAFFALFDTLVLALLPLFGLQHGLSAAAAVLSASVALAGDAMLQLPLGWLADRIGRVRVHWGCGLLTALLVPLLPLAVGTPLWWPLLYLLGGAAGGIYTLAMVACGERFSGRALVAASGLISATWSVASCVAPLAAGGLMQHWRPDALVLVLWLGVALFLWGLWRERHARVLAAASE